jgi:hypothetical protein
MNHRARRAAIGVLAMTLSALSLTATVPATAESPSAPAPADVESPLLDGTAAASQADQDGKPVEVTAWTTESQQTFANPGGGFTVTQTLLPARVRRDGAWIPIDTSLEQRADGTLIPRATTSAVVFSGGGDGPLAVLDSDARQLAFEWPSGLPKPSIDGPTATYPEVLPGVDLRLTVNEVGGFSQLLVVKTAEAAANPQLAKLEMKVVSDELEVHADAAGVHAVDAAGVEVFAAATPFMWDSGKTGAGEPASGPAGSEAAGAPEPSGEAVPVDVEADGETLTLTPDQDLLTSPDTQFPVYIDPDYFATGARQAFTHIQQGCPTANYYNNTAYGYPAVGYNSYSGCIGIERAYYRMVVPSKTWGTVVSHAEIEVFETYSASCSVTTNVSMYGSGTISTATTWNSPPTTGALLNTQSFGPACTSQPSKNFDVTNAIGSAAGASASTFTFGLRGVESSSTDGLKRFSPNPVLRVTYNSRPYIPTGQGTSPALYPSGSDPCGASPTGDIGNTDVTLKATIKDADGGSLGAHFQLWKVSGTYVYNNTTPNTVQANVGYNASVVIPSASLGDVAATYSWRVIADDGALQSSDWSPICKFDFDPATPESAPDVDSTEFPKGGNGDVVGTTGTFTFNANGDSSVTMFRYQLNAPVTTSSPSVAANGGVASVAITVNRVGGNTLYVKSYNNLGSPSAENAFGFNAAGPAEPNQDGDFTGDSKPDLVGVGAGSLNGGLYLYQGNGAGLAGSRITIGSSGWSGSLISRGDFDNDNVQDILVRLSSNVLYVYQGQGYKEPLTTTERTPVTYPVDPEPGAPTSWAQASQIAAIQVTSGDPLKHVATAVYAIVNDQLWRYSLSLFSPVVETVQLVSNSGWTNKTIASASTLNGQPGLWARDKTTGALTLYVGGLDANGEPIHPGHPASAAYAVATSGWPISTKPLLTGTDFNSDGYPDIWATSTQYANGTTISNGTLLFAQGAPSGTTTYTVGPKSDTGGTGWISAISRIT